MSAPAIVWLRDDLRLDDQPAIRAAADRPALFVYIHDETSPGLRQRGGASRWWLAHSLQSFSRELAARGARLDVLEGPSEARLLDLAKAAGSAAVFWTRRYGGGEIALDSRIKSSLKAYGVVAKSFNGQLLREPWEALTESGLPYRVFTPFWRRSRTLGFAAPEPAPQRVQSAPWPDGALGRVEIADLRLTPAKPDWSGGLNAMWRPGEAAALARLGRFLDAGIGDYAQARDRPDGAHTSMLSPHLRFGEISPRRIAATVEAALARGVIPSGGADKFLAELGWREFSYAILHAFPDLATRVWLPRFERFPFRDDSAGFKAWSRGETGYPIVDAGMRELWATGYMHNRVRMIAASFLVKHLLIDWRLGERWFWDTLCDADPASNPASWQWVAGSGADAAPYFRIFNPVLQAETFDSNGAYIHRWIPELARLRAPHVHAPWRAPDKALGDAGVQLGRTYPMPIVDHSAARARAMAALAAI